MINPLILPPLVAVMAYSCTTQGAAEGDEEHIEYAAYVDNPTEMSFEHMRHDFGTVKEGERVKHTFKFKNTGDQDLILIDVNASCGCTVAEDWPKHPIAPGKTGTIKVVFDSRNRVGKVDKRLRIEANTLPSVSSLTLTGSVTPK